MYRVTGLEGDAGLPNAFGEATLPPQVSLGSQVLMDTEAYLLEDGNVMALWIGARIPAAWLEEVFGVGSTAEVGVSLPAIATDASKRVNAIAATLSLRSQYFPLLHVVKQGDRREPWFASFLIEDKQGDVVSYVDHLCHLHRSIQHKIANSK
jgi:protein transport protein SEC24